MILAAILTGIIDLGPALHAAAESYKESINGH
jgi:hypothetical protein